MADSGRLTVSFPITELGFLAERKELYSVLFHELMKNNINEEEITGVQIFPAKWPRKIHIALRDEGVKDRLLIQGLEIQGRHIELRDENTTIIKVVVKDAPLEWGDEKLASVFEEYGEILRVEKEMIYVEGKRTTWTTGTRYIFFSALNVVIPHRISVLDGRQTVALSVWYRQQTPDGAFSRCRKCGSGMHNTDICQLPTKACYMCQQTDHLVINCPQNDGTKSSDEVTVFLSGRSLLSNFNENCPIVMENVAYSSTEKYIQMKKAELFNDTDTVSKIKAENSPRVIKRLGGRVKNYSDSVWQENCEEIVSACVEVKFRTHKNAREALLETGSKVIGEASRSTRWGVGLHISDDAVLDRTKWTGANMMGNILMCLRGKLLNEEEADSQMMQVIEGDAAQESLYQGIAEVESPDKAGVAVILGDSHVRDCVVEHVPLKVVNVSKGGTPVQGIADQLKEVKEDPRDVKVALLHVGTCNWGSQCGLVRADIVYREYIEALSAVTTAFPHAELVISSVPPRVRDVGSIQSKEVNSEINVLNEMLKRLSKQEENVYFIDNDGGLMVDSSPCIDLYRDSDITGVHLNNKGRLILIDNIQQGIREAFYKANLRHEWNVYPKTASS